MQEQACYNVLFRKEYFMEDAADEDRLVDHSADVVVVDILQQCSKVSVLLTASSCLSVSWALFVYYVSVWEWVGMGKLEVVGSALGFSNMSAYSSLACTVFVGCAPAYAVAGFVLDVCRQYTRLSFWRRRGWRDEDDQGRLRSLLLGPAAAVEQKQEECTFEEFEEHQDRLSDTFTVVWDLTFLALKAAGSAVLCTCSYDSWVVVARSGVQ